MEAYGETFQWYRQVATVDELAPLGTALHAAAARGNISRFCSRS